MNQRAFAADAAPSSRWSTIMAYNTQCSDAGLNCSRLFRFSNPRQHHDGDPLGVPYGPGRSGPTGSADAAAVLAATAPAVALWRHRVPDAANQPPAPVGALPERRLAALNATLTVDVSAAFADPEGDALGYRVSSSAPHVVTVLASGAHVTLTAVGAGAAVIRVTATDPGGLSATQSFVVTVTLPSNRPPEPVGALGPLTIGVEEDAVTVDVSGAFRDPDDDALTYAATSSAPAVAVVSGSGSRLTVTPVSAGTAAVTVTATDVGGSNTSATQVFAVTVTPPSNRPPEPVGALPPLTMELGGDAVVVDVSGRFHDPDGDGLTYAATSSAPAVAAVTVSGSTVTVTPVRTGTATARVTATDAGGSNTPAIQSFAVTVVAPFSDHPIVPGETPVRVVHFAELRWRIDGLRTRAGLAAYRWTDPVLTSGTTPVRLVHLLELRSALDGAYAAAGRAAPSWTDEPPAPRATAIRAVHLMELRAAVVALERGDSDEAGAG